MGNMKSSKKNMFEKYDFSYYSSINEDQINDIRKNYKVMDVNHLDSVEINSKILHDEYFRKSPEKKEIINNILEYHLQSKYSDIYKVTQYLCSKKEKICICNSYAEDFRKLCNQNIKYVSWAMKYDDN
jgi:hypothetical protein